MNNDITNSFAVIWALVGSQGLHWSFVLYNMNNEFN